MSQHAENNNLLLAHQAAFCLATTAAQLMLMASARAFRRLWMYLSSDNRLVKLNYIITNIHWKRQPLLSGRHSLQIPER